MRFLKELGEAMLISQIDACIEIQMQDNLDRSILGPLYDKTLLAKQRQLQLSVRQLYFQIIKAIFNL